MERLNMVVLDRSQFYEQLWTLTGQELRIRYALSPYRLDQLCDIHQLPQPRLGYWTKVRHGRKAKRTPLPKVTDSALERIFLLENDPAHCRLQHDPIAVPPTLTDLHPRLAALRHQPAGAQQREGIEFDVGPLSGDRALRVLDTLVRSFEACGGDIFESSQGLFWGRRPDGVGVGIGRVAGSEDGTRLAVYLTTNRQVAIKGYWADTNSLNVETCLRPVINSIFESAARIRWKRLEQDTRDRQREKLAVIRQQERDDAEAAEAEREFGRRVLEQAIKFHEVSIIRRYARATRRRLAASILVSEEREKIEQWIGRAMRYADSVDPMLKQFPITAASSLPENVKIEDLDMSGDLRLCLAELGVSDSHALYRLTLDVMQRAGCISYWEEARAVLRILGYIE